MTPDTATAPAPDAAASNAQLAISPQALSLGDGLDAITRALIPNYEAIKKLTEAERYSRTKTMLLKNPDSAKEALLEVGKPLAGGYVAKCYLKDVLPTLRPMAKAARDFLKINGKPDKNGNIAEGKKAITWEDIGIEPTEEINYGNGDGKRKIKPTDPIGWGSYCVQILGGGSSYINTFIDGGEPDGGSDEGNANKADFAKPALSARAPDLRVDFAANGVLRKSRICWRHTFVDCHAALCHRSECVGETVHLDFQIPRLEVVPHQLLRKQTLEIEILESLLEVGIRGSHFYCLLPWDESPSEQMICGSCVSTSSSIRQRRPSPRSATTRSPSCWSVVPARSCRFSVSTATCCRGYQWHLDGFPCGLIHVREGAARRYRECENSICSIQYKRQRHRLAMNCEVDDSQDTLQYWSLMRGGDFTPPSTSYCGS